MTAIWDASGSSGRVTSERIGRDLNPLGRGDGSAYVGGAMNYGRIAPRLPRSSGGGGWGNTVNNRCGGGGCGGGGDHLPHGAPPGDGKKNPPPIAWSEYWDDEWCMGKVNTLNQLNASYSDLCYPDDGAHHVLPADKFKIYKVPNPGQYSHCPDWLIEELQSILEQELNKCNGFQEVIIQLNCIQFEFALKEAEKQLEHVCALRAVMLAAKKEYDECFAEHGWDNTKCQLLFQKWKRLEKQVRDALPALNQAFLQARASKKTITNQIDDLNDCYYDAIRMVKRIAKEKGCIIGVNIPERQSEYGNWMFGESVDLFRPWDPTPPAPPKLPKPPPDIRPPLHP